VIRAVIDTNVLVSSLLSPSGNEALILLAVTQGLVTPCISDDILREYAGVLSREKFSFPRDEVEALTYLLRQKSVNVAPDSAPVGLSDPDDEKFVACARAGEADFIVTGNKRHFPAGRCGVAIVSAAELLDQLTLDLL
jgi:putative PIN family toxin of toxin-antitoxin system